MTDLEKQIAILDACWNECGYRQCDNRRFYSEHRCPYLTRKDILNYQKVQEILKLIDQHFDEMAKEKGYIKLESPPMMADNISTKYILGR